jgi:hypothetical protein
MKKQTVWVATNLGTLLPYTCRMRRKQVAELFHRDFYGTVPDWIKIEKATIVIDDKPKRRRPTGGSR